MPTIKHLITSAMLIILLISCASAPAPIVPASTPTLDPSAPILPTRTPLPPDVPTPTFTPPPPTPTIAPTAEAASQYYTAGVRAYGQKNYTAAILNFTQALQLDPKNALIYLSRAQTYLAHRAATVKTKGRSCRSLLHISEIYDRIRDEIQ